MKRIYDLFAVLSIACFVNAQTVENVTVRPDGDNIRVTYRIGGSTDAQIYTVTVNCSVDGGRRFEPKTLDGDYGANIRGGKSIYLVIWDVFEDVDEVGNVEFFVKVDLVSDMAPPITQQQNQQQVQRQIQPAEEPKQTEIREQNPGLPDHDFVGTPKEEITKSSYLAYTGSTASPYGISFGGLKNFGGYGSFRMGYYIDDWENDVWATFTTGLTKFIMRNGKYRLYGFAGIGITYEVYEEYIYDTSWTDSFFTFDLGIISAIGKLNLILGLESVRETGTYPVFGIGFDF